MKAKILSTTTSIMLLTACAVGPDYEAPQPTLPQVYTAKNEAVENQSSLATSQTADLAQWWEVFQDPVLNSLVETALTANHDLRETQARVREARALWGVARGKLLPELSTDASYERLKLSESGRFPTPGNTLDLYQAGFDASWEIDVFGGRRRELEAASAALDSSIEALRDAQISLLAEIARNYVELAGLQARLAIAQQNLEAQQKTAAWTRARFESGWTTELDLTRAQALVSSTSAQIPSLEASLQQTMHRLAVLMGQEPTALADKFSSVISIPKAPAEIPVGLPTDLLRRRPDIRRAERDLAASTARIGIATADLYPRFFLLGAYGTESSESSDLLKSASRTWSFGPAIRWSLFQGGRIRANIEVQNARQEQAAIRFEKTLLIALQDVEDALIAHAKEQQRRHALADALSSQQQAVELAQERYSQGLVDFLIVLDTQRSLFAAHDSLVQSEQAVATNTIAIYKAVGGGWVE